MEFGLLTKGTYFSVTHQDEIATVRQLQHRNIIKCLASFAVGHHLWIVMPLIAYTSASRLVASHFTDGLSEPALALIFKDVLCGLHYLHSKGIIHRFVSRNTPVLTLPCRGFQTYAIERHSCPLVGVCS